MSRSFHKPSVLSKRICAFGVNAITTVVPRFVVSVPFATVELTTKVNDVAETFVTVQVPFNLLCSVPVAPEIVMVLPVKTLLPL